MVFVLTKLPDYGNTTDTYSACGICAGIKYIYPLSKWTCSKPANIKHNTVTINMNIYENCDFKWRWRNLAFDSNSNRAYEFENGVRTFHIGAGCGQGMITKVETEWDIKRGKFTGDCVSAPAPRKPVMTIETNPTLTYPQQTTTENPLESTTSIFQSITNPAISLTDSTDQSHSTNTTASTDQSTGSPPTEVVSEAATKVITASTGTTTVVTLTSTATVTQLSTTFNPASISFSFMPKSMQSTIPATTTINTKSTTSTASTMSPELQTTSAITQLPSSNPAAFSESILTSTVSSGKPNSTSNHPIGSKNISNPALQPVTATEINEATTLTVTNTRASQPEQGKIQSSTRPSNSSLSGLGVLLLDKH